MSIPWPDVPASLFGYEKSAPLLNVPLRWFREERRQDVTAFKEGYRRAAVMVAERARERRDSPDYLVWPVTWLWRHYLELVLKDIVARGPLLQTEAADWKWPSDLGHQLATAWERARPFIVEHGDPDAPEIANVGAIIAEFDRLDRSGFGFRYPVARDGVSPGLATHEDWLNIDRIDRTMQQVASFLDAVVSCQEHVLYERGEVVAFERAHYDNPYDRELERDSDDTKD